jgi:hypothetical protein
MAETEYEPDIPAAATGIPGLDEVLGAGFPAHHLHLVEGAPSTASERSTSPSPRPRASCARSRAGMDGPRRELTSTR